MKKVLSLLVAIALCLTMAIGAFAEEVDYGYTTFEFADTTGGRIRGYRYNGVYTFMGIPYAQAGRFEEPQDTSWEGTLIAPLLARFLPNIRRIKTAAILQISLNMPAPTSLRMKIARI